MIKDVKQLLVGLLIIPIIIVLTLDYIFGSDPIPVILALLIFYSVIVSFFVWTWYEYRLVWRSDVKSFKVEGPITALVESALRGAGVRFRREADVTTAFGTEYHVLDITGTGLRIHIDHVPWVYIGPVGEERRYDIDRLQVLVDKVLG